MKNLRAQIEELSSRQTDTTIQDDTAVIIGAKNMEISNLKAQISELKAKMEK